MEAYKRLTAIVRGYDQYAGPQHTGPVQTATRSDGESGRIVREAFAALGVELALQSGESPVVGLGLFQEPSPKAVVDAVNDISKHGLRVFGDTHCARRRKALAEGYTPLKLVGTFSVALGHVGARLEPEYEGTRRTPTRYNLRWEWKDPPGPNMPGPPDPKPAHPNAPAG